MIWKKVTYPGVAKDMYMVSENGDIMNTIRGKPLKLVTLPDGYLVINLAKEKPKDVTNKFRKSNGMQIRVHRLVAWEFCPGRDMALTVDHLDGNRGNNCYTNLEWVTFEENAHRTVLRGSHHIHNNYGGSNADIGLKDNKYHMNPERVFVEHVCELLEEGYTKFEIFRMFVPRRVEVLDYPAIYDMIYRIQSRISYGEITKNYNYPIYDQRDSKTGFPDNDPNKHSKYGEAGIRRICELLQAGYGPGKVVKTIFEENGEKYNYYYTECYRLRNLVNCIRRGEVWSNIYCEYDIKDIPEDVMAYARKMNQLYDECDSFIKEMIDAGRSTKDIHDAYGINFYPNDEKFINKIDTMIANYKMMKDIKTDEEIEITAA